MSRLSIARKLLANPDTEPFQLTSILSEFTRAIETDTNIDSKLREKYNEIIVLLYNKIEKQETLQTTKIEPDKTIHEAEHIADNPRKYYYHNRNTVSMNKNTAEISSRFHIPLEKIVYYSQREFFPENPKAGDMFWLNHNYLNSEMSALISNGNSIWHPQGTINLKGTRHPLWIGDLRIDIVNSPRKNVLYLSDEDDCFETDSEKIITASPVINFERVEALYSFYSDSEHKPTQIGELGWTKNIPQRASPKLVPNRSSRSRVGLYSNRYYDSNSLPLVNVGSDYLIKIQGFVIFIDGVSDNDLWQRSVFDVEYHGNSLNGRSGKGKLVTNHIRELVTQNIEQYRQLEKEFK